MKTRNGIFYNLSVSEYRLLVNGLTFVFSSRLHMEKFKSQLQDNRAIINYSLSKRFKMGVELSVLADIVLYRKIETRGFLILTEKKEPLTADKILFKNGRALLKDNV